MIQRERSTILDIDEDLAAYCFQILAISVLKNHAEVNPAIVRITVKIGIALSSVSVENRERLQAKVSSGLIELIARFGEKCRKRMETEILKEAEGRVTDFGNSLERRSRKNLRW